MSKLVQMSNRFWTPAVLFPDEWFWSPIRQSENFKSSPDRKVIRSSPVSYRADQNKGEYMVGVKTPFLETLESLGILFPEQNGRFLKSYQVKGGDMMHCFIRALNDPFEGDDDPYRFIGEAVEGWFDRELRVRITDEAKLEAADKYATLLYFINLEFKSRRPSRSSRMQPGAPLPADLHYKSLHASVMNALACSDKNMNAAAADNALKARGWVYQNRKIPKGGRLATVIQASRGGAA